jgi:hypothetical protein
MAKLRKPRDWWSRPRTERLAAVWFPGQVDQATRDEMARIAASERKKPPRPDPLIPDHKRGARSPLGGKVW